MICRLGSVLLGLIAPGAAARGEPRPVWLVVTRPVFAGAVEPLARHRRGQGFEAVVSTQPPRQAIAALPRRPGFVLLVGDGGQDDVEKNWHVPTRWRSLYRWRRVQRETFAADALYGDVDGDLIPDVPVGRIPARTPRAVRRLVDRIVAFENRRPALDDLCMPVWAGSPGYDPAIDAMATGLALSTVRANAPAWLVPWVISADPAHPLCGWPGDHAAAFTRRLARGGAVAAMMGHGNATAFYSMPFDGGYIRLTADTTRTAWKDGQIVPPVVIFSCDCGFFAAEGECLAEAMMSGAGGAVATIAATTESHPLPNYFSGLCLLRALGGPHRRLGEVWLAAQRDARRARDPLIERLLRDAEGKLEDAIDVAKLRRDQLLMYAILGDPATRLRLPAKLHGRLDRAADGWAWQVDRPAGATRLWVGFRPDASSAPTSRPADPAGARRAFERANVRFAFEPVAELGPDEPWRGGINRTGTLRLVAETPDRLHVAALRIVAAAGDSPPESANP